MWYWPIKQSNRQGFLAELLSRKSPAVKASAEKSWSKVVWLIIGIRILNSGVRVYSNEAKMGVEQKNRMYLYKDLRAVILLPSAQSHNLTISRGFAAWQTWLFCWFCVFLITLSSTYVFHLHVCFIIGSVPNVCTCFELILDLFVFTHHHVLLS